MKRSSKRRFSYVLVKAIGNDVPKEEFVAMFQSPKVPEKYAWRYAVQKVRNFLKKNNIPFEQWTNYLVYPVTRFNCSTFDNLKEERLYYEHIYVADYPEEDDKEMIDWFNKVHGKYNIKLV